MLKQFGSSIICIDSTHSTNQYGLHLTTTEVVAEFGNGIPVSFCFSQKKDTDTWIALFNDLKNKVGVIKCNTFMSDDDDPAFYNAWEEVMLSLIHISEPTRPY